MLERRLIESMIASCGCLEETWIIGCFDVIIHFDHDEAGHHVDCFVDAGDWDVENRHDGVPDVAREAAFQFIESWGAPAPDGHDRGDAGLSPLARAPGDDPVIVECWL